MNKLLIIGIIGLIFATGVLAFYFNGQNNFFFKKKIEVKTIMNKLAYATQRINPTYYNPNLKNSNVDVSNGLKISYKDYSVRYVPYFVMKDGTIYNWKDIPSSVQKNMWKKKIRNNKYKYGIDFLNVPQNIRENIKYVVLHRKEVTGLTADDIRIEGNKVIIKNKITINHNDLLSTYKIPIINKTDVVISGLNYNWTECVGWDEETGECIDTIIESNWKDNGDGTWNIRLQTAD